jgi:hypothetical protein
VFFDVDFYKFVYLFITPAAAVAIAYDMWEDNEFVKETEPGDCAA